MGSSITRFLSRNNISVLLKDMNLAMGRKGARFSNMPGQSPYKRPGILKKIWCLMHMLIPVHPNIKIAANTGDLKNVDIVIETVGEDIELKKSVFKEISSTVSDNAIIASNTSSIPISHLSKYVNKANRFLGLHFFYPVDKRPSVEVVRGKDTDEDVVANVVSFLKLYGKIPVVVNDCPGFLVNRVLAFYAREATYCLLDGARIDNIDRTMLKFGMPIGPMYLMD